MANANNWKQHSEQKPEFTDYTVAGTNIGRFKAGMLAELYEQKRTYIRTGRTLRKMCRATVPDALNVTAQSTKRCGYPKKRERNEDIPSHRGVPNSNFLKRFKIIDRITYQLGEFHHSAKIYVLHATRGWKLYA